MRYHYYIHNTKFMIFLITCFDDHGLHPKPEDDEEDGVVGLSLLDDEDLVEKFKLLEDFITLAKFMLFLLDACFTFDSGLSL